MNREEYLALTEDEKYEHLKSLDCYGPNAKEVPLYARATIDSEDHNPVEKWDEKAKSIFSARQND